MQIAAVFGNVPHHCSRNDNGMQDDSELIFIDFYVDGYGFVYFGGF